MKDRIKQIMDGENLTPARFADRLQISRPTMSHILNGRNNPSLDVVTKILDEMNYIDTNWLLFGVGNMYKKGADLTSFPREPDLFSQNMKNNEEMPTKTEKPQGNEVKSEQKEVLSSENKLIEPVKVVDKKITQIIIYYDNNTYEAFMPHSFKN